MTNIVQLTGSVATTPRAASGAARVRFVMQIRDVWRAGRVLVSVEKSEALQAAATLKRGDHLEIIGALRRTWYGRFYIAIDEARCALFVIDRAQMQAERDEYYDGFFDGE